MLTESIFGREGYIGMSCNEASKMKMAGVAIDLKNLIPLQT